MDHFELVSEYKPTGDQPEAIKELVEGFKEGNQCQTLLGVTGSGFFSSPIQGKLVIQTTRFETIRKNRKIFQFRITPDHRLLPSFYV